MRFRRLRVRVQTTGGSVLKTITEKFNAFVPWPLRYLIVVGVGLAVAYSFGSWSPTLWVISVKLRGNAPDCPWPRVLSLPRTRLDSFEAVEAYKQALTVENYDEALGLELLSLPTRRTTG